MLKKFTNINQIYFRNLNTIYNRRYIDHVKQLSDAEFNSIINYIILNCRNIIHFDLFSRKFYKHVWDNFVAKYSEHLISVFHLYTLNCKELVKMQSFRNLKFWEFNTHHSYNLDNNSEIIGSDLHYKNLRKLCICYCCMDYPFSHNIQTHDFHFLSKLINNNRQIVSLTIRNDIDFSRQFIKTPFKEMDLFFNLNLLEFKGEFYFKDDIYNDYDVLMKLSRSMKNVKKLDIKIRVQFSLKNDNTFTMSKIMKFFENLVNLEELDLNFDGVTVQFRNIKCEVFHNCKKLKKLSIFTDRYTDYFDSTFFTNCQENLHSLRILKIKRIKYDKNLMKKISQCKNLTKLFFSCLNLKEYQKCKFYFKNESSLHIKSIELVLKDFMMTVCL